MRVGIVGLLQESNTFIGAPTTLEHFRQDLLLTGESIRERLADAHHEVGGFFAGLRESGMEAVPILVARALPYGTMTADTYAHLRNSMLEELRAAGPLDGVLAACHGADVADSVPDADGDWLRHIRTHIGPARPLIGTLDPHANVSRQMVDATDALIAYRTNPHIDQRERGVEAARLMVRMLRGEVRPTQAASFPPLVINIERQETSNPPLARHYEAADEQLRRDRVLSNSFMVGFPYADVAEMGCAAIVVTDNDPARAQQLADDLGRGLWRDREAFIPSELLSPKTALQKATSLGGPRTHSASASHCCACLLDMGDNVGGGSPGDGTVLIRAIHDQSLQQKTAAFACLYDPQAVKQAEAAGPGATVQLRAGGKTDNRHGEPLAAHFTVQGIYSGRFRESEPRHGGFGEFDQGRTAVVETAHGLTLMLTSRRMVPFSLQQLLSCNVDPTCFRLLVVKGVHAPVAAYAPVCDHFLRVNTPGVTRADLSTLEYRHRRRPLFPFERDFDWA